ncbi:MAG: hypothetical protein ABSD88_20700 [Candidatus Korobacteraceae bacterium]|jgi:hypothetical protein
MGNQHGDLYHGLSAEELQQAHENLERYFELALQIAEQSIAGAQGTLDIDAPPSTMEERSTADLKT